MQEGQQPNEPGWVFRPGDAPLETAVIPAAPPAPTEPVPTVTSPQPPDPEPIQNISEAHIEWSASEYLANPKNAGWFSLLAVGSFILAIIVYLITRDILSTVVIVVIGILVGVFAARQPQTLQYRVDNQGLYIGDKFYPYESFKSFSVAQDSAIGYISLLPLKRFMPPLVIHYASEDEARIVETLTSYLPYEDHKTDVVENLSRRFRF